MREPMDTESRAARAVARLEADVQRALSGRDRVVLSYSGGLASLVLAAVARKHGDLRCVVVGTRGAADVEAALVAKSYLDYPVDVLRPSRPSILRTARALHGADPRLSVAEALAIVPLTLVAERWSHDPVLSGFGLAPRTQAVERHLIDAGLPIPGRQIVAGDARNRRVVLGLADALGLPASFSRAARRSPAEGSGVGPALRGLGHARRTSVERLVSNPPPGRDYHEA